MVFPHLPSNLLLAAVPFATTLPTAIALLLGRFALSQNGRTSPPGLRRRRRLSPGERTAAAAYTNSARYAIRPTSPLLTGLLVQADLVGAPFLIAGTIKASYDLGFWTLFRRVPLSALPGA